MMAYRIAYCKVTHPLAYYAAYFGIRADAFSYEIMCQGKETLNYYYREYKSRQDHLSKKRAGYDERYEDRAGNVRKRAGIHTY